MVSVLLLLLLLRFRMCVRVSVCDLHSDWAHRHPEPELVRFEFLFLATFLEGLGPDAKPRVCVPALRCDARGSIRARRGLEGLRGKGLGIAVVGLECEVMKE